MKIRTRKPICYYLKHLLQIYTRFSRTTILYSLVQHCKYDDNFRMKKVNKINLCGQSINLWGFGFHGIHNHFFQHHIKLFQIDTKLYAAMVLFFCKERHLLQTYRILCNTPQFPATCLQKVQFTQVVCYSLPLIAKFLICVDHPSQLQTFCTRTLSIMKGNETTISCAKHMKHVRPM